MSSNVSINTFDPTAPTPQNTPLVNAPIAAGLSRPTIPDTVSEEIDELDDGSEGPIAALSVESRRGLVALLGVQVKQTELQQEFKREVWALEKKYLERTKPLYERRTAIISGSAPTVEEVATGKLAAEEIVSEPLPEGDAGAPIPEFWLTALRNHVGISELITDRDAGALKHLTDIRLEYLDGDAQLGFKLSFYFSPTEYFEDKVLEKTYFYKSEIDYSGDFIYDRAIGTPIAWKEDKDLTKEFEVKKQRNKNTNRIRLVRKAHSVESFFGFFMPPSPPPEDDIDEEDEDALDAREELESRLELDYQIGEDIRDRIIPRAVDYYTGKCLEWDGSTIDDDEWDEEDESDEEEVAGGKRHPAKGRGAGKKGDAQEECKQQ